MGVVQVPSPVILIAGLIAVPDVLPSVRERLRQLYGPFAAQSRQIDFTFTDYYAPEMGTGLTRQYVAFQRLIAPESLPDIKLATNRLESEYRDASGRRRVNIDPGYLTLAKLVLATTKDFQHRLYLRDGIYAEVTLRFRAKHFSTWEWTYPDYRSPESLEFFGGVRERLRKGWANEG